LNALSTVKRRKPTAKNVAFPLLQTLRPLTHHAIAEALSLLRKELRDEFARELASLRADMNIQTGIARGEIAEIKRNVA
jgi:hypothetical protein